MTKEQETRHCDVCGEDKPSDDVHIQGGMNYAKADTPTVWECGDCRHKAYKLKYAPVEGVYDSMESALEVDGYPWGFRLRTKKRYWLETTKHGDRLVSVTMDPRTGKWCKPKKSTYSDVGILTRETATGYISWHEWSMAYSSLRSLERFLDFSGAHSWKPEQLSKFAEGRAVYKTREYVHVKIRSREFRHKVTGEVVTTVPIFELGDYEEVTDAEHEAEQRAIKADIARLHSILRREEASQDPLRKEVAP